MNIRSTSLTTLGLAAALLVGCWTGASSEGLPCTEHAHCGLGYECINGFCGGEPSDALCGNGWVDPGEACDEAGQNSNEGACRPDCTLQVCGDGFVGPDEACDAGADNSDSGECTTLCTVATCGDGFVGPGEECDGNAQDNMVCGSMCRWITCGNGIVEGGEDCDDGGESATCDDDCTAVECGDGNPNAAAGEVCDNGDEDDPECMANCTVPLLWDDSEPGTTVDGWTHEKLSGDVTVEDTWARTQRLPEGGEGLSWDSGQPAPSTGDTRLMSPTIDLGGLEGETIELRFDHAHFLRDCNEQAIIYEGVRVEVSVDGGETFVLLEPDNGYMHTVGNGNTAQCVNPLDGEPAFGLDANYAPETFDLSAHAGSSIIIGFHAAWDCGNCTMEFDQSDRGWFIDNVVVWTK